MDARITKQRLGNLLSYDWLKILGAIVAAVLVLSVFFTMVATRPRSSQIYSVYAYDGTYAGTDFATLGDKLLARNVFSYDILKTGTETFDSKNSYGGAVFTARRSVGEGTVMFVSGYSQTDEEGNKQDSLFESLVKEGPGMFLDPEKFMADCAAYLSGFYDGDWRAENPVLNEESVRQCFLARNGKDKRFRSAAKKEEGVLLECERVEKLRGDYLTVEAAFEGGVFEYAYCTAEDKVYTAGIGTGKLATVQNLAYYTVERDGETVRTAEELTLVLFNNGDKADDLKYETVSFLKYLLDEYNEGKTTV